MRLNPWHIGAAAVVAAAVLYDPIRGKAGRLLTGLAAPALVRTLAARWGAVWGVPADWILAIAKIESAWNPRATNLTGGDLTRGGAYGLMQMTHATAQGLAPALKSAGAKLGSPEARAAVASTIGRWKGDGPGLLDPDVNVMFGAFYLARLSAQFGGRFETVAAAYNRGAGAVAKMIARKQDPAAVPYAVRAATARKAIA